MFIKSNLVIFGIEESIKYYIIDLVLEFGIRIRLMTPTIEHFGSK